MYAVLWFAIALAAPAFAGDGVAHRQCQLAFLEDLGWNVAYVDAGSLQAAGGAPCERANLAAAHAAGDLHLKVPRASRAWLANPQSAAEISRAIDDPASQCAFAIRLGGAARSGVDKLVRNERFKFSGLQTGWIGFGLSGHDAAGWQPIFDWGRGFVPARSNTAAIDAFYSRGARAECGVGRQIAQYATFAELFGPAGFDRAFEREEIVIGTFNKLARSQSVLLGSGRGEMIADGLARKTSALGRQAFNGVPGFLYHVFDASTLSDISDQAQNFIIYDVDDGAAEALRRHGGFAHYNRLIRRTWELSEPFQVRGLRWFERLLIDRDPHLIGRLTRHERQLHKRMSALLDDPFFTGFRVYGHPHGVKPIGYFVARMLDQNPRTPYRLELALHNLHTEIYQRYARDRIAACERNLPFQGARRLEH